MTEAEAFPYIAFVFSVALLLVVVVIGFRIGETEMQREREDDE